MKPMIPRMVASTLVLVGGAMYGANAPAAAAEKFGRGRVDSAHAGTPVYSPWARSCGSGGWCQTMREVRLSGRSIAVTLIEAGADDRKVLRVVLPPDFRRSAGARMFIDDDAPRSGSYIGCGAQGCVADFAIDAAFMARLKTGQHLQIQGVNVAGLWTHYRFPLGDFTTAVDRSPIDPAVLREPRLQGR
jgi:invasion protein IalB